jgi:protein ImuB
MIGGRGESQSDREALEKLADWCGRFSPVVGIEEAAAPESLLLDITGLDALFGGEAQLAGEILRELAARGLTAVVAVADAIGAAWAMAHFGTGDREERERGRKGEGETHWTKVAGESPLLPCSPSPPLCSTFILHPSSSPLSPSLPVIALRLPEQVAAMLHQLGIDCIGQLEMLPRADLLSRFGPELLRRWDQATGRLGETVPVYQSQPEWETGCWLEHPTTQRKAIELVLQKLLERLEQLLAHHGQGAMQLTCRLDCPPERPIELTLGLFQPTASARHLLPLVAMQLERLSLPAAVVAIHVRASLTAALQRRQGELFSDLSPWQNPRHVAQLIERLSSRLGSRAVFRPRLVPDPQPELAYRYRPLVNDGRGQSRRNGPRRPAAAIEVPPRPLRLLRRPIPLATVSIVPDGPPLKFSHSGGQHQVARTWGPERIETGWWRNQPVGRDYYRVETTTGHRFWLFRRLRDGHWFLHGLFE